MPETTRRKSRQQLRTSRVPIPEYRVMEAPLRFSLEARRRKFQLSVSAALECGYLEESTRHLQLCAIIKNDSFPELGSWVDWKNRRVRQQSHSEIRGDKPCGC